MTNSALKMRNITKSFGSNRANDSIDIDVYKGEILALLGENGAGKSTLMKILFGLYSPDSGSIEINGKTMPPSYSPREAMENGIAMVHQHFKLVDSFSVAENIVLGAEEKVSKVRYDRKKVRSVLEGLYEKVGIKLDNDTLVRDLPLGDKQRVEILKTLYRGSSILILDEPTTVLTPQETEELFSLLKRLKAKGMTIIIITHKLNEVMEISDRIVVLRQGKVADEFITSNTDKKTLAKAMVGYDLVNSSVRPESCEGISPSLIMKNVITAEGKGCSLKGLDLSLYPGRIVGVAGVDGNGQSELVEILSGVGRFNGGSITVEDSRLSPGSQICEKCGIRVIPEDRHKQGLVLPLSVQDNVMLGFRNDSRFRKGPVFRMKKVKEYVTELEDQYDIRPRDTDQTVQFMSGGNQQKVVLARELSQSNLKIVVASQPTRGLDVGAIEFTHSQLIRHRAEGKAVLLISSDLDEILALSDEIAVLYDGRIVVQKSAMGFGKAEIGLYMGGGGKAI